MFVSALLPVFYWHFAFGHFKYLFLHCCHHYQSHFLGGKRDGGGESCNVKARRMTDENDTDVGLDVYATIACIGFFFLFLVP